MKLNKGDRVYCIKDRESFSMRIKKCNLSDMSEENEKKLFDFLAQNHTDYLEFIKGKIYIIKELPSVFNNNIGYGIKSEREIEYFTIEKFEEYFISERD